MSKSGEDFAKAILNDVQLFYDLIQVLNKAGEDAVKHNSVKNAANDVCVLPMGINKLIRRTVPLEIKVTPKSPIIPTVHFDHRSITIVGGAAVQIYKNNNPATKNNNYRQTTDIDAVWWPKIMMPSNINEQLITANFVNTEKNTYLQQSRNPNSESDEPDMKEPYRYLYNHDKTEMIASKSEFAVVSSSWAIQSLVQEYNKQLKIYLDYYISHHGKLLETIVSEIYTVDTPVIKAATKYDNVFVAGISNVWGFLVIYDKAGEKIASVKLIEMTIHDGASSQISNTIQHATNDVVYSLYNVKPDETTPRMLSLADKIFQVPPVHRLLDQQIFALKHRNSGDINKIQTTMYRIKYLYKLLLIQEKVKKIDKYEAEFAALCTKDQLKELCESVVPLLSLSTTKSAVSKPPALLPTPLTPTPTLQSQPMYDIPPHLHGYATAPMSYTPGYAMPPPQYYDTPAYLAAYPVGYGMGPPQSQPQPMYYASTPTPYTSYNSYTHAYTPHPTAPTAPKPKTSRKAQKSARKGTYTKWIGITSDGDDILQLIDTTTGNVVGTEYRSPHKGGSLTKKRKTRSRKNKRSIK